MRHNKSTFKLNRNASHRRSMIINMVKSLIEHERILTTVAKAKELRKYADKIISLAKKETLAARRKVAADLRLRRNKLTSKEARLAKKQKAEGIDPKSWNFDRKLIDKLFNRLSPRFHDRQSGFTRIIRVSNQRGDNAPTCIIEYLPEEKVKQ